MPNFHHLKKLIDTVNMFFRNIVNVKTVKSPEFFHTLKLHRSFPVRAITNKEHYDIISTMIKSFPLVIGNQKKTEMAATCSIIYPIVVSAAMLKHEIFAHDS